MTDGTTESYEGRTALVVGAARSGLAAAEFLLLRGARVVLTDLKSEEELGQSLEALRRLARSRGELELELGGHREESFRRCDFVIVSPGVPLSHPCFAASRAAGIPVLAEVELACRHLRGRILGVTGSNGKTTTTALLAELLQGSGLRAHAAGNIGIPLISFVANSTDDDIFSTELSSFQLEGIHELHPVVGAVLNITPDHLDRYPSFEAYVAAKKRIFMNQTEADFAVLNADDDRAAALASEVRATPVRFSRAAEVERGAFVREDAVIYRDPDREVNLFPAREVALLGAHNLDNVLAACAMAILAGARDRALAEVVRGFRGVEHRLEWVAEIGGVRYFNDSKATNVDSAARSIEAFPGGVILIAGGRDKGGDFSRLRSLVGERVKSLILLGEASGKIREALSGATEIREAGGLPEAVTLGRALAAPGDVVLLAPACASFDMFRNYEERGRVFKDAVRMLERERN